MSTNANANQTPPRSATFPFTLSTLNSFNPFNLFNPMKRLALLLPLLALAAAPARADSFFVRYGDDYVLTPETEEAYRFWTRTQYSPAVLGIGPDKIRFTVGVPRTLDGAKFAKARIGLWSKPGRDARHDLFDAFETDMRTVPCGSAMLEFYFTCSTQFLDRACVVVLYDRRVAEREDPDGVYEFFDYDCDRYILPLDRYAANRIWEGQSDVIGDRFEEPAVTCLALDTESLAASYRETPAETASRIGKMVDRFEALRGRVDPSETAFLEAVSYMQRHCRFYLAEEDVRAAEEERARGIFPAGTYTNDFPAVIFRVYRGKATVSGPVPGRQQENLDVPDRLGGVPVASVESDAFADCADLRSVSLPDSLRSVGFRAFLGCTNLTNVVVGAGLKVVEFDAFSRCPNLAAVRIAATNATIYANAFRTEDGKAPAVFEVGGVPSEPPAYKPDDEDEEIDE